MQAALSRAVVAVAAAGLAVAAALLAPGPLNASCAPPPRANGPLLDDAEIVIVGTVRATTEVGRWATVVVHEVWRGPDLPPEVLIRGGGSGNTFTSIDRTYEVGVRYLFAVSRDEDGTLHDNACSATTPWTDDLVRLRPADARIPAAETSGELAGLDLGGIVPVLLVVGVVAALLLGAGLVARGREA